MNLQNPEAMSFRWVDSHAHLDMEEFDADRNEVIQRAGRAGVQTILCPADLTSTRSLRITLDLADEFPFLMAAGVHPHQAKDFSDDHRRQLVELRSAGRIAALGEIGLDFHYDFSPPDEQRQAFRAQLRLAEEIGLPVIIHSRQAGPEVISAIREDRFSRGGILHCFTEDWATAETMIDLGFFISFSGILTFPKAERLREVARKVPRDRLLVETDAPYLAPVPWRGRKRNEPSFIVETARVLAELKEMSLEELAEITTRNFFSLLGPAKI